MLLAVDRLFQSLAEGSPIFESPSSNRLLKLVEAGGMRRRSDCCFAPEGLQKPDFGPISWPIGPKRGSFFIGDGRSAGSK